MEIDSLRNSPGQCRWNRWSWRTIRLLFLICIFLGNLDFASAQQKGQWVPGQFGLNAGAVPDPGFTCENLAINYSAGQLNNSNGNAITGLMGNYSSWVDENIFMYVPKYKFLGGYFVPYISVNVANGSLVADLTSLAGTNLGINEGGAGLADIGDRE